MSMKVDFSMLESHFSSLNRDDNMPKVLRETWLQPIVDLQAMLMRPERQVTIFGEFNVGKSTFLNALMGQHILPMRQTPSTARQTRIYHDEQASAFTVHHNLSGETITEPFPLEEIKDLRLFSRDADITRLLEEIEAIEIRLPLPLLVHKIVLADTAGLNDEQQRSKDTIRVLETTDLAIMVLSSHKGFSLSEDKEAQNIQKMLGGNIVFIFNPHVELNGGEKDEMLSWIGERVQDRFGNVLIGQPRLFTVNAKQALEARCTTPQATPVDLTEVEHWLTDIFSSERIDGLVAIARLSILNSKIERAVDYLLGERISREQQLGELKYNEEKKYQTQLHNFNGMVVAILGELDSFRQETVSVLGKKLKKHSFKFIEKLSEDNTLSRNEIKSIETYVKKRLKKAQRKLDNKVDLATTRLGIEIPDFHLKARIDMNAETLAYEAEELVVEKTKSKTKAARKHFENEAVDYILEVEEKVREYASHNQPQLIFSSEVEIEESIVHSLEGLIQRCQAFLQEIIRLKTGVLLQSSV